MQAPRLPRRGAAGCRRHRYQKLPRVRRRWLRQPAREVGASLACLSGLLVSSAPPVRSASRYCSTERSTAVTAPKKAEDSPDDSGSGGKSRPTSPARLAIVRRGVAVTSWPAGAAHRSHVFAAQQVPRDRREAREPLLEAFAFAAQLAHIVESLAELGEEALRAFVASGDRRPEAFRQSDPSSLAFWRVLRRGFPLLESLPWPLSPMRRGSSAASVSVAAERACSASPRAVAAASLRSPARVVSEWSSSSSANAVGGLVSEHRLELPQAGPGCFAGRLRRRARTANTLASVAGSALPAGRKLSSIASAPLLLLLFSSRSVRLVPAVV